jgi:hypothetical protein
LSELGRLGASGSRRKWWAFEGFTSVDFFLETDALLLLIFKAIWMLVAFITEVAESVAEPLISGVVSLK